MKYIKMDTKVAIKDIKSIFLSVSNPRTSGISAVQYQYMVRQGSIAANSPLAQTVALSFEAKRTSNSPG